MSCPTSNQFCVGLHFVLLLLSQITDSLFIARMVIVILAGLGGLAGSALLFYMDVVQTRRPITGPLLTLTNSCSTPQANNNQQQVENLH